MQAGLANKRLTLRDIFSLRLLFVVSESVLFVPKTFSLRRG
jgi:hypothetical protein